MPASENRALVATGAGILVAAALLLLAEAGTLDLGWAWAGALVCLVAGLALIAVAPPSRAAYTGALVRLAGDREGLLWSLRAGTVVLAPVAGAGPAAYALLALGQALDDDLAVEGPAEWRRALGTSMLGLSVVVAAGEAGLHVGGDTLLWPVLFGASAVSAYWWSTSPSVMRRIGIALALCFAFVWMALGSVGLGPDVGNIVLAVAVGALAGTLVVAPRLLRTTRALAAERVERARATERSEMAGRVHDSVLQTLALIQSRADDPVEVKALARRQERDLRAQLFVGVPEDGRPSSIATALRLVASEVEDAHRVKVEVVTLGDAPLDERSEALVAAAREALSNAAVHASDAPISLFGEIDGRAVTAFIRDRGPGFDLEAIPADRRGVRDSIVARMVRHGGHAAVRTAPGGGCEVRLVLEDW